MPFKVSALPHQLFADLSSLTKQELAERNIRKMTVDAYPGYPCRVSLEDARVGETVYLLNYRHHDAPSPYASSHAVFVRENAQQATLDVDTVPDVFKHRTLSVRGFDQSGDIIIADIVEPSEIKARLKSMLNNESVAFLHVHNAKPGCFSARVDRA